MTKDQKRIVALEKEVKELREEIMKLAMRPAQIVYYPSAPIVNPAPNYVGPGYTAPIITCGVDAPTLSASTQKFQNQ